MVRVPCGANPGSLTRPLPREAATAERRCAWSRTCLQGHQPAGAATAVARRRFVHFSCSGGISADLFHKIVASAGADAGVDGYILKRLGGAPGHPMTLEFPEGEYLKGLVVMRKG